MKIPTPSQCTALWDEYDMPDNIRQHTLVVTDIAVFLATKLKEAGEDIDVSLIRGAALLHDIAKYPTLNTGKHHGYVGKEILVEKGYPEIGQIVSKHAVPEIAEYPNLSRAEILINYSDRRVNHDQIVSLDERFAYLRERYHGHRTEEEWDHAEKITKEIENEIFTNINLDPSKLEEYIIEFNRVANE